jgi:hypothetical protein
VLVHKERGLASNNRREDSVANVKVQERKKRKK